MQIGLKRSLVEVDKEHLFILKATLLKLMLKISALFQTCLIQQLMNMGP